MSQIGEEFLNQLTMRDLQIDQAAGLFGKLVDRGGNVAEFTGRCVNLSFKRL